MKKWCITPWIWNASLYFFGLTHKLRFCDFQQMVMFITCYWCCLVAKSHGRSFCDTVGIARQAPLSMGFSRQEYWSQLPFASPGDLPNPGIEPTSPALANELLTHETTEKPTFQITSSQNGTWMQRTLLLWSIIPTRKSNPFLPRIELWVPCLCIWKGEYYKLHLTWIYGKVDIVSHISSQLIKV